MYSGFSSSVVESDSVDFDDFDDEDDDVTASSLSHMS